MFKKFIFILLCFFIFIVSPKAEGTINAHLFYRDGCPHCDSEKEFFKEYLKTHDDVKLYIYDVVDDEDARNLYKEAQEAVNKKTSGVPYLVIGNQTVIGYANDRTTGKNIERIIEYYRNNPYRDLIGEITGIVEVNDKIILPDKDILSDNINIPFFGSVNPKETSLPIIAMVIGFIDGFNPCAMWILIFLITMLFGMKDRKKMWILGVTFLLVSAFTYFIFMVSWLNIAQFMSQIFLFRLIISLIALVFGIINISKFFKKAEDGCEVVDDKRRRKIMDRIKNIISEKKFILALFGIAVLAVMVNIVELLCSLGLPVIYTQVLAMNDLSNSQYYTYLLIYILFFLFDDLLIFFIAMKSLKIKAVSNKYTKYSHLIGGIIMLLIGLLMILKPEWLMFNI